MPDWKSTKIPTALLARFLSGELTVRAQSRLLHRDPQALLAQLRGLGIDTSRSHRKALAIARGKGYQDSAAMGARAAELYTAGLSLRRVASETGLTCEGVRQVLLRNGVNVRGRGRVRPVSGGGPTRPGRLRAPPAVAAGRGWFESASPGVRQLLTTRYGPPAGAGPHPADVGHP
jgi:hypothetical protein